MTLDELLNRLCSTYPGGLTTEVAARVRELQEDLALAVRWAWRML